jgi:TolB-like protein/DNA-binding winged helix-turn-helix (wHTH) protein/Flp pilus assembly protein TadD
VRFGVFELDVASGDLWKHGIRRRLHGKPLDVLQALLERPGAIVSRKELQERLWTADTHVEFENGLNNAIGRLREALGDPAESPRFVETVPRRGYRFIAPVESVAPAATVPLSSATPMAPDVLGGMSAADPARSPDERSTRSAIARVRRPVAAALAAAAALALAGWLWIGGSDLPSRRVAVLPFVTAATSGPSTEEYVAFGITDAIIAELARTDGLDVISQTSALRYRGTTKSLPEIARELGAGTIVEGSVVREGEQVRITVQLVDARDDTHRWTETYRKDVDGLLAAQGDLAREMARAIRRELTGETTAQAAARAVDPRVREAHLKGRYFISQGTEDGFSRALSFFEEALAIDPAHAPSHSGIADYYILTDSMAPDRAIPRARVAAERALALDPALADAHASLAFLRYYGDWDWVSAERAFVRALDLNPNHTRARRWYGQYLAAMGRSAEAERQVQRVMELDPVSLAAHGSAAQVWLHTKHVDRLLDQGRRILELNAHVPLGYEHIASAHVLRGDHAAALTAVERGLALSARDPLFVTFLGVVQGAMGRSAAAQAALSELRDVAGRRFVPPFLLAMGHLSAGDRDGALTWLERGYEQRDLYLVFLKASPWMDPLRAEARFQALLQRMRFP